MYDTPLPRRNKTNITRSRTGCLSCRTRRKKCDERWPCSSCEKLGKRCQKPQKTLAFRSVTFVDNPDSSLRSPSLLANTVHSSERSNLASTESKPSSLSSRPSATASKTPEADELDSCRESTSNLSSSNQIGAQWDPIEAEPMGNLYDYTFDDANMLDDWVIWTGDGINVAWPSVLDASTVDQECVNPAPAGGASDLEPQQSCSPAAIQYSLYSKEARTSAQLVYYYNAWNTHCVPVLHLALRKIGMSQQLPVMLREAVLALAACHISRMTPQKKPFDFKTTPGLSFRPDPGHQATFCEKYGSTLLQLASWKDLTDTEGFDRVLTGMILLAHVGSLMGDFRHFGFHSMGIDTLLCHLIRTKTVPAHSTCQLIAAWAEVRAQNWWLRFHYSTADFHYRCPSIESSPWLTAVLEEAQGSRSIIMTALCESCRLASVASLSHWDNPSLSEYAASDNLPGGSATSVIASLQASLDRWHEQLPLSSLPIETFVEPPPYLYAEDRCLDVKPLRFASHQCAMEYAYYVLSRLFLCSYATSSSQGHPSLNLKSSSQDANSWALLLARIAAGLDWDECLKLNRYVIGFSSLILPAILHSSDPRIGFWLQDWIEQRYTSKNLEEGCFPVLQVLQPLRTVNREYREGRDVKAVFTRSEDGGGDGKYNSYNSQHIDSLLIYSRTYATGQCHSHTLWL